MKILTMLLDIASAFLRLVEAEGRILKRAVMNVAWALACVAAALFLFLIAALFFLAGSYQYLAAQTSPAAASLLVSLLAFILAAILAALAKQRTCDPK